MGRVEGEGPSHCLPQALSGTVNRSWKSLVGAPRSDTMAAPRKAASVGLAVSERATDWWPAALEDLGH